ncbi:acyl carrier protein [Streptomyces microflavus]|uniref:Acyl carrier protein n=1 Tax=Streptomyces microflavus DSM 40593 TaxID=1303692 RepID=N0CNT0_STRMI|nr:MULTISPECIES: phosphopantetheine-binding protein [Streptomyces]AGK77285.1 Putative acyl carrier protein [Streptomyces microflavus DSM 40593]MDX2977157.1 phosphopantetheine-binding protein [Streptomyces sp. NRRL_B-2249]WSA60798.1 phosphopantetheine-binding protein [Streptomyces microflavus]WSS36543.1 phosphopantetheine-binding protein [Streptomyces microflavus]WST14934.1 phosphopantetheine-binding protein [Streptomyces microflavus]
MERVYTHLVTLLGDKFEVAPELIRPDTTLGELDLDSLAVVELYVTLQEEWGVPLDDSAATAELTVDEVARSVAGLLAANGTPGDAAP